MRQLIEALLRITSNSGARARAGLSRAAHAAGLVHATWLLGTALVRGGCGVSHVPRLLLSTAGLSAVHDGACRESRRHRGACSWHFSSCVHDHALACLLLVCFCMCSA